MLPSHLIKIGLAIIALGTPFALIQAQAPHSTHSTSPAATAGHSHSSLPQSSTESKTEAIGDPYTLSTCPVSGQKLGESGNGREKPVSEGTLNLGL